MIPTGNKLLPFLIALIAPVSAVMDPLFFKLLNIHFFLALYLLVSGVKIVQNLFFSNF